MSTTTDLLDALRVKYGITSDYALAKRLNVTRQCLSGYRHGKSSFDDQILFKVADLLDRPHAEIYIAIQAERAAKQQNKPVFDALSDALRRLGGIAAAVLLFIGFSTPPDALYYSYIIKNHESGIKAAIRLAFDDNANYAKQTAPKTAWLRGFALCLLFFMMRSSKKLKKRPEAPIFTRQRTPTTRPLSLFLLQPVIETTTK